MIEKNRRKNKYLQNDSGITIVVLVVAIIIMVLLATITVSAVNTVGRHYKICK